MAGDVTQGAAARGAPVREFSEAPSRWGGWIVFAATMLVLAGGLNVFHGLVAVFNDEWVVWTNRGDLYFDLTTWAWVHVGVGAVMVVVGLGLFSGNVLARAVAVFLAAVSIVVNFASMPAYPVWALTVIVIDAVVIYALTAHGRDLA